jgi:hypothetical protein
LFEGSIRTYNVSNGLLIKKIGEKEYTDKTGIKKTIKEQKGEISHLHFVNEDKLLISTSWDTTVNIYDETGDSHIPAYFILIINK